MDKELFSKQLGDIALIAVDVTAGSLIAKVEVPLIDVLTMLLNKVKVAIPGQIDDMVIDLIIATVKTELLKP